MTALIKLQTDLLQYNLKIPEYQRPYVWIDDQVSELLEDVMQARNSNPESEYLIIILALWS